MKSAKLKYKLADLIDGLEVTLKGDPDCLIDGISTIQQSERGHITFLANPRYKKYLSTTRASAVILTEDEAHTCPIPAIVSSNPYYTFAKIAEFFHESLPLKEGIHPSVILGEGAQISPYANIGAYCHIGNDAKIAAQVILGPGCVIGEKVEIGECSVIDANVTIYPKVKIGKRTRIASGVVIGSDGFGFANQEGVWHKVPQLGTVLIGDDVDIGANTTIDRGALEDTLIANGVKLDNLIQIGHNVKIGEHSILAGCVGVAGSTTIGKNCMIGGAACLAGHIQIADNVMITGMTAVSKSIKEAGIYSSGIVGAVPNHEFRKNNARFHRLENLVQRVRKLEQIIKEQESKSR